MLDALWQNTFSELRAYLSTLCYHYVMLPWWQDSLLIDLEKRYCWNKPYKQISTLHFLCSFSYCGCLYINFVPVLLCKKSSPALQQKGILYFYTWLKSHKFKASLIANEGAPEAQIHVFWNVLNVPSFYGSKQRLTGSLTWVCLVSSFM